MQVRAQPVLLLFLLGVLAGSALDAFHVFSGVEHYPTSTFFGLAWWVPLVFGSAAVAIGYSHPLVDPLLHHRRRPRRIPVSLGALTWLVLAYLITASFLDSRAKVGLLAILYFNFWLLSGGGWQNLVLSLVTAITGTLIEMILVTAGAFSYLHPDFIGVPYWLPCMYACASLAIGDVGRSLLFSFRRRRS